MSFPPGGGTIGDNGGPLPRGRPEKVIPGGYPGGARRGAFRRGETCMAGGSPARRREKELQGRSGRRAGRRCANCWVCQRGTALCPREEDFDQEAYDRWLEATNEALRKATSERR